MSTLGAPVEAVSSPALQSWLVLCWVLAQGGSRSPRIAASAALCAAGVAAVTAWWRFRSKAAPASPLRVPPQAVPQVRTFLTKDRQPVRLAEKIRLSPDTFLFRFALPHAGMRLGLPVGKHIRFVAPNPRGKVEGEWNGQPDPEAGKAEIERKYTPASLDRDAVGRFDLIVKVYRPCSKFCDGGKMSQHLDRLQVGDTIDVSGPFGLVEYKGNGTFILQKREMHVRQVGMLAGGTGITPMLQLLKSSLSDPNDPTTFSLLYANRTEQDILAQDELQALAKQFPARFSVAYTLTGVSGPVPGLAHARGRISCELIQQFLPGPAPDRIVLMCGPAGMVRGACKESLTALGWEKGAMVEF